MTVLRFPSSPRPTWYRTPPRFPRHRYLRSVPNGPGAPARHPRSGCMRLPAAILLGFWSSVGVLWAVLR